MGEQGPPSVHPNLMSVMVELNLRESGTRFPCKWSSVLKIYRDTAEVLEYLNQRIQKARLILSAVCQNHGAPL